MARGSIKNVDKRLYPESIRLTAGAESNLALEASEGESKLKKFSMTAYTGGAMRVGFGWPVVVDLSGMAVASQSLPILKDHDASHIVAHSTEISLSAQRIKVAGIMSGVGVAAQEVAALAGNGFPWQASIGASIERMEFIDRGEKVTVNGKSFEGPVYVARKSTLGEVSFVAMGADSATSARVAASRKGEQEMEFTKWLEAKGFNAAELGDTQTSTLKAAYDAEVKAAATAPAQSPSTTVTLPADSTADIEARRKQVAAEEVRIAEVRKLCGDNHEICAKAIGEGWSVEKTELAALRAARPQAPAAHISGGPAVEGVVIEAALHQAMGVGRQSLEKHYKPEVLQAAHTAYKGRLSLQEMIISAARKAGFTGHSFKAEPEAALRAAFSTADISGILSNTANKSLLDTYMAVESSWREIAAIRPVSDFKAVQRYRITGDVKAVEVGPTGELTHGNLGEQSYTNQAKTYGRMLALTRQDLINDDLGALNDVLKMMGRGAALRLNTLFWTAFLDNASFFSATHTTAGDTGNSNLSSGAGSAISVAGLTAAELLFLNQVDPKGEPLGIEPKILLVPNALSVTADQLMNDLEVRDTTASTKATTGNPHRGKFKTVRSSYLSNSTISGYSTAAWYLLASPMDVPTIEVCFLNGQETPVVESADADFNVLGIQMRSYFDTGVAKQDYRGGVKSSGS